MNSHCHLCKQVEQRVKQLQLWGKLSGLGFQMEHFIAFDSDSSFSFLSSPLLTAQTQVQWVVDAPQK